MLIEMPQTLTDSQLALCQKIELAPLAPLAPVPLKVLLQSMRVLETMPSRATDDDNATLRLNLFKRHFAHHSEAAWAFAVLTATIELKWMPDIHEMAKLFKRFTRDDPEAIAKTRAGYLAREERQRRYVAAQAALRARTFPLDQLTDQLSKWAAMEGLVIDTDSGPQYRPTKEKPDAV